MQQFMNVHLNDRMCSLWIILVSITFEKSHVICLFNQANNQNKIKMHLRRDQIEKDQDLKMP